MSRQSIINRADSEILHRHLDLLVAKHRLRKDADFQKIREIYPPAFYRKLRKTLLGVRAVRSVSIRMHDFSCVDCILDVRFKGNSTWGVNVELSTISPFYRFRYITPKSDVEINAELIKKEGRKALSAWLRNQPAIPSRVFRQAELVMRELPAFGLVHVPDRYLAVVPRRSRRLPKAFYAHRLGFFFFDSVPFFG
jgi:hypothetical protein